MEKYRYGKIDGGCLFAYDPKTQITLKFYDGKWHRGGVSFDILSFDDEFEELTVLEAKEIYGDNDPTQAFKKAYEVRKSILDYQPGENK